MPWKRDDARDVRMPIDVMRGTATCEIPATSFQPPSDRAGPGFHDAATRWTNSGKWASPLVRPRRQTPGRTVVGLRLAQAFVLRQLRYYGDLSGVTPAVGRDRGLRQPGPAACGRRRSSGSEAAGRGGRRRPLPATRRRQLSRRCRSMWIAPRFVIPSEGKEAAMKAIQRTGLVVGVVLSAGLLADAQLRLEARRGPVEVIVVEHAERPSPH